MYIHCLSQELNALSHPLPFMVLPDPWRLNHSEVKPVSSANIFDFLYTEMLLFTKSKDFKVLAKSNDELFKHVLPFWFDISGQ